MLTLLTPPVIRVYAGTAASFNSYTFKDSSNAVRNLATEGFSGWRAAWSRPEGVAMLTLLVDATQSWQGRISVSATAAQTRAMGDDGVWELEALQAGSYVTFVRGRTAYQPDVLV